MKQTRPRGSGRKTASGALILRCALLLPLFASFVSFAFPGAAAAAPGPEGAGAGSLLLRAGAGFRPATRIDTEVNIDVSGLTIRASLRQVFRNDGDDWVEGVYVFPLPEQAALNRLSLTIGRRVIEGEIRETEAAAASYEAARSAGRRASLVRRQRPNLFTTRIANIGPGETVTVEIGYVDTARFEDGTFSLRFPMTLTPRFVPGLPDGGRAGLGRVGLGQAGLGLSADTDRVADASLITPPMTAASPGHRLVLDARINAGMPLALVASRYHAAELEEQGRVYRLRFGRRGVAMDRDVELLWRPARQRSPRAMLFSEAGGAGEHLLLMLVPPGGDTPAAAVPPRELVFVIDTSGSMHGASLGRAKSSLLLALDGLRPVDRFNVIEFDSVTRALFARSESASPANLEQARDRVRALRADGGTEMRPALDAALAVPPVDGYLKQVVFITDGSVGNEEELFAVIERGLAGARLFTVGIGSAPNGWFMRKAAETGRGAFVTIGALQEVEQKMGRLMQKLERPVVSDIALTWPAGLEVESYPARSPDLYAGEPVVIKARLGRSPRAGDQLVVTGRRAGTDWRAELAIGQAARGAGIATVWARARLADLMDRERRGEDPVVIRRAIVDTALGHGLVSKYTSLVAVDKTPARPADATLAAEPVPNLMPQGQGARAMFAFPATATIAPAHRRNGALLLGLGAVLLLLRVWTQRGPGRETN